MAFPICLLLYVSILSIGVIVIDVKNAIFKEPIKIECVEQSTNSTKGMNNG